MGSSDVKAPGLALVSGSSRAIARRLAAEGIAEIAEKFGRRVDVLVNNVAAARRYETLFDDNIAVNSLSPNRGVATEHPAGAVPGWPYEPEDTMAEAALLLSTEDPREADGSGLLEGWQPEDLDEDGFLLSYLNFNPPGSVPEGPLLQQQ